MITPSLRRWCGGFLVAVSLGLAYTALKVENWRLGYQLAAQQQRLELLQDTRDRLLYEHLTLTAAPALAHKLERLRRPLVAVETQRRVEVAVEAAADGSRPEDRRQGSSWLPTAEAEAWPR